MNTALLTPELKEHIAKLATELKWFHQQGIKIVISQSADHFTLEMGIPKPDDADPDSEIKTFSA